MAGVKITDLTAIGAAALEDLIPVVDDPSGTPSTKKVSLQQVSDLLRVQAVATESGTTRTLGLTDDTVLCDNAATITVTVPDNASVAFPIGTTVTLVQQGAGQVDVDPGVGVTVNDANGDKTAAQYSVIQVTKTDTDEWVLWGDATV